MSKIYLGDIGTRIELDAGVSISSAEVKEITYKKPDGTTGVWDAELSGTQVAYYITLESDLDVVGLWEVQLYIEMAGWKGTSATGTFTVHEPIELYDSGEEEVHGNYITESDVDNWEDNENKQEVIDRAEQLIESITKDCFYSKAFSVYLDGNGKDRLFPGLVGSILTVTEILISGVELPDSMWTFDKYSVYIDPEAAYGDDMAEVHLRLKYQRVLFPTGKGNIKITGTVGWTSCPPAIKRAAIILCKYENDPTLYPAYSALESERFGDTSFTRGKFLTGVLEADRLIRSFIRKRTMPRAI